MKYFNFCTLIFFIFLAIEQDTIAQVKELSLKEAINSAFENNVNITKTRYSIEAQESIIRSRYGSLFPNLSLNAGWSRSNQVFKNEYSMNGLNYDVSSDTTTDNFNLSLRSEVLLFNGFANYDNVDIAKMSRRTFVIQEEKLKNDLALRVISEYVDVLRNQQIVLINEARLQDAQNQLERIRQFVQVGKRTMSDVYKQDVQVAQYELAVEQSKNNVDKSIAELVNISRLPQNVEYAVKPTDINNDISIEEMNTFVNQNSNVGILVNRAFDNRDDIELIEHSIDINEQNLEIQRKNLIYPSVSAFSTYNLSGGTFGNILNRRNFTVGLNISYPIFQGFQFSNLKKQAEIELRTSETELDNVKASIELDIKKSVLDIRSLLKQIEITERTLKAAEQDKILAEQSYAAGLATILDVQTATIQYNNALIERSNLNYNFILAQKQLEYYQGLLKY